MERGVPRRHAVLGLMPPRQMASPEGRVTAAAAAAAAAGGGGGGRGGCGCGCGCGRETDAVLQAPVGGHCGLLWSGCATLALLWADGGLAEARGCLAVSQPSSQRHPLHGLEPHCGAHCLQVAAGCMRRCRAGETLACWRATSACAGFGRGQRC